MLLNKIFQEEGIVDIIYEYKCGISYRKMSKIVLNNFEIQDKQVLYQLTEYFCHLLENNKVDNKNSVYIRIYLKKINRILHKEKTLMSLFRTNYPSIHNKIRNTMKDLEKINNINYLIIYHAL